jgi:hypothetical protein
VEPKAVSVAPEIIRKKLNDVLVIAHNIENAADAIKGKIFRVNEACEPSSKRPEPSTIEEFILDISNILANAREVLNHINELL